MTFAVGFALPLLAFAVATGLASAIGVGGLGLAATVGSLAFAATLVWVLLRSPPRRH